MEVTVPGKYDDVVAGAMVDFSDIEARVKEGFVVHEVYAKGAVMFKRTSEEAASR